jgi:hypothetical protein
MRYVVEYETKARISEGISPVTTDTMHNKISATRSWLSGHPMTSLFLLAGIFWLTITLATGDWSGDEAEPDGIGRSGAVAEVICQQAVSERLRAPSTAEFTRGTVAGYPYTVTGRVEAGNAFGGRVSHDYRCIVRDDGPDHQVVESVAID